MLVSPLIVVAFSVISGARVAWTKWAALAFGLTGGVCLLNAHAGAHPVFAGSIDLTGPGTLMTLGAALCLALSTLTSRRALAEVKQSSLTFWSMLLGFLMLLPQALSETQPVAAVSPKAWAGIFYLAVICSVGAYMLWNHALTKVEPHIVASSMHLKTPVAILLGVTLNGEKLTAPLALGTGLVVLGVWLSQQAPRLSAASEQKPSEPTPNRLLSNGGATRA
jgi:drug/metabolite transporter (DMT)-like permease